MLYESSDLQECYIYRSIVLEISSRLAKRRKVIHPTRLRNNRLVLSLGIIADRQ